MISSKNQKNTTKFTSMTKKQQSSEQKANK